MAGWVFLVGAIVMFTAVTAPVIIHGAPLLDDFSRCLAPQKSGFWSEHFSKSGAFRPMKVVEIGVINSLCRTVPFSLVILIPWFLTLGVAFALRAFLRELRLTSPWPEIGAGLWLFAPLGTESALWPSALHVSLGLLLALIALRMLMRSKVTLGLILGLVACLGLEQLIFAFPLAAWWVSPSRQRSRVLMFSSAVSLGVIAVYAAWPGSGGRLAVPISERLMNTFHGPASYVEMVGVGLGAHSIPTAIRWAFPVSLLVLAGGATIGWVAGPRLLQDRNKAARLDYGSVLTGLALLALLNLPLALTFPHPDSPRVFAPSWLALVTFATLIGSRVEWRRRRLAGAVAGALIAGSVLSLALSSSVRVRSARIVEDAMEAIAAETPDGGVTAVCGRTRTVVDPAPSGDFSIHEFFIFAEEAYEFYTGKIAVIRVDDADAKDPCPDLDGADAVFEFQDLIRD